MTQKEASTLLLFGAKGNLARVKLFPGLFKLDLAGKLHPDMKIVSIGRQEESHTEWIINLKSIIRAKYDKIQEDINACSNADDLKVILETLINN